MEFGQAFDPIRSLQSAWKLLKQAPVMVLIGGLLLAFLEGGGSAGAQFNFGKHDFGRAHNPREVLEQMFEDMKPWLVLLIPLMVCVGIAFFALSSWIEVGFARAIEHALRSGRDEIGKVFSGGDRFGAMLLARFLSALIQVATFLPVVVLAFAGIYFARHEGPNPVLILGSVAFGLLWLVFELYVSLGLCLVNAIVAFESCSPTEAIGRSWKLASGHRLQLFWFMLLQVFLALVSILCTCCLGLFITVPLMQVMRFEAYVALTKGEQFPHWWIGSGKFPFDEPKAEDFGSPQAPPPVPPPLPPQG